MTNNNKYQKIIYLVFWI